MATSRKSSAQKEEETVMVPGQADPSRCGKVTQCGKGSIRPTRETIDNELRAVVSGKW